MLLSSINGQQENGTEGRNSGRPVRRPWVYSSSEKEVALTRVEAFEMERRWWVQNLGDGLYMVDKGKEVKSDL